MMRFKKLNQTMIENKDGDKSIEKYPRKLISPLRPLIQLIAKPRLNIQSFHKLSLKS